jgi:hypothetical protein
MEKKLKKSEAIDKNGKVWTKTDVQNLLATNDTAVIKGMLRIYAKQTSDEKQVEETREFNGVGFNGLDGKIMSSFSTFYSKNKYLSPKQMKIARNKMKKYAGQLIKIIQESN